MQYLLQQGARYRAKLKLNIDEIGYDNDAIRQLGEYIGLADITVTGGGTVRRVVGTWNRVTQTVDLPEQIKAIEEVNGESEEGA